ncbi:MAG: response regulator [Marinobacter sp.]|uniref:response regulator n=1 Tax=Marinobacter sp. TaxID=50741 RepID=UPI00299DE092|nr:response regulator [Marinobacter sp.]MDX1756044.1 response regulator [Marinobacter sp.]
MRLLLWLTVLAVVSPAVADQNCSEQALLLQANRDSYDLGQCVWYLEDPDKQLNLRQVRSLDQQAFRLHQNGVLNFGYTESAYWFRYDLRTSDSSPNQDWILELALPLVDDVTLYVVRNGLLVSERHGGYDVHWSERDLAVPNPAFRLSLPRDSETQVYLRITSDNTLRLPITLWHPGRYIEKVSIDEVFRGILLGSILGILAYNLFVAVSVRERSNIYYVLYLVTAVCFIFTEQVHGIQLFGDRPWFFHKQYLHLQIIVTWFFGLLMARELLETKARSPDLDQVIRVSLYGVATTFVLALFMPYHVGMEWTVLVTILLSVIMIVISYLSWRHYNPAAKAYFYAWTVAVTGFVVYALTVIGLLPLNIVTAHASQIGLAGQIILFSFALADRIKLVQGEALSWSERALANLRQYRSLFDNAVEGVFQMSLDRRFLTANPAMAELMGYSSSQEMIRRNPDVLALCFGDDRLRRWVVDQLQDKGMIKGVEARYVDHRGDERWATISLHTVYDREGTPLHLEGTCIDATERHQRQRIEKEREQERLDKELARNSAAAKSQFLANMSHEIRTPLAAIIGYGETLLDPDLDEAEKRSSAETVVRSGRHLLDLVNDILDHSKIDANKLDVDIVTVNLPEMLDELRAFFEPRAREKGLEFSIACEYPLPETIHTDPTRFRQIIINLCGNALKFTQQGAITMTVRCDREAHQLITRVVDTGIGMREEQLKRLFDPFAQGSAAIARQYGGTGLGLSISRRLAELLGGTIVVNSTYGEGSDFEVSVATGSLEGVHFLRDASEFTQRRRQLPMVVAPRLRGRILCAEDNEVNRKLVSLLVARTGAELVHVPNGAEALEIATQEPFDLILMDIQMPVMNGRDAAVALREAGINVPIVALTANVMAEDIEDYREAGFTEHLAKPIDKLRFYEMLGRYLGSASEDSSYGNRRYRGLVLVAEDNQDNRRLVERMLGRLELEVISVSSGEEAVKAALSKSVHLVLMDRHMPGMDGVAATRLLRQAGFRRPIIAFTAGDQREIDALIDAGCEGVLTKPIDQEHLVGLLDRYLETEGGTEEHRAESLGIQQLVDQFLAGLGERKATMLSALQVRDQDELRQQAHQIKGTAGAMGYPLMTEQAGVLERGLKQPTVDWAEAEHQLEQLNLLIDRALTTGRARAQEE